MYQSIRKFLTSEDGPTSVEYAVMLMLIVTACIGATQVLATSLGNSMDSSSNAIKSYLT